jgi:hypothetical protein
MAIYMHANSEMSCLHGFYRLNSFRVSARCEVVTAAGDFNSAFYCRRCASSGFFRRQLARSELEVFRLAAACTDFITYVTLRMCLTSNVDSL